MIGKSSFRNARATSAITWIAILFVTNNCGGTFSNSSKSIPAGSSSEIGTSLPTPTPTPLPSATPRPTATPRATATPAPVATPSPTPRPTATPMPTPVPTPRPTATPMPSPTPNSNGVDQNCSTSFPVAWVIPSQRTVTRKMSGHSYRDLNGNGSFDTGEVTTPTLLIGGMSGATGTVNGVINHYQWFGDITLRISDGGLVEEVKACMRFERDMRLDVIDSNTIATSNSMIIEGRAINKVRVLGTDGLTIKTDENNQHVIGGPGNDNLDATTGSDILEGRGGNDTLVGGDGLDMAIFSGRSTSYSVSDIGSYLTISSGAEGTDALYGIEILRFADGDFVYSPELKRVVALPASAPISIDPTPLLVDDAFKYDQPCSTTFPLPWSIPSQRTMTKLITGHAYTDRNGNGAFDAGEGVTTPLMLGNKLAGSGSVNGVINTPQWVGDYTLYLEKGGLASEAKFCVKLDSEMRLDVIDANTIGTSKSMIVEGRAIKKVQVIGTNGLTITTDWGNQHLVGGAGNDVLDSTKGSDILEGRGGNDTLRGGDGIDMAVFSGRSGSYAVTDNGTYQTVSGGADGTDTLHGIELLRFTDGDFIYSRELGRLVRSK